MIFNKNKKRRRTLALGLLFALSSGYIGDKLNISTIIDKPFIQIAQKYQSHMRDGEIIAAASFLEKEKEKIYEIILSKFDFEFLESYLRDTLKIKMNNGVYSYDVQDTKLVYNPNASTVIFGKNTFSPENIRKELETYVDNLFERVIQEIQEEYANFFKDDRNSDKGMEDFLNSRLGKKNKGERIEKTLEYFHLKVLQYINNDMGEESESKLALKIRSFERIFTLLGFNEALIDNKKKL